jgi:NADH-quinone oxidoreductase subunit L
VWAFGLVTAGMTAFYMFRLVFLAFYGSERFPDEARHHLHESPRSMTLPLVTLAVLSVVGGFVGLPAWMGTNSFERFLEPSLTLAYAPGYSEQAHGTEMAFAAASVLVALAGIFLAYMLYVGRPQAAEGLAARFRGLYRLLFRKYYVDELYDAVFVNPTVSGSRDILWKGFDVGVVDGAVNGVGSTVQVGAGLLKYVQNGLIRSYAAWILLGAVAVLFYIAVLRG